MKRKKEIYGIDDRPDKCHRVLKQTFKNDEFIHVLVIK